MNKKCKKKDNNNKLKNKANIKLVCPQCNKNKKAITLDDGYVVCAYCGLVILKQKYSLEQIDAPGFKKIYLNKQNQKKKKTKKNKNKHYNLVTINDFIMQYSTSK